MKSCYLTVFILLIFYSASFPQNYSTEAKDSTISQYDLKYGKQDKSRQIFFSYAAGYSSLFPDDKQPDPFLVHEAAIGYYFNKNWAVSLRFEFWKSDYKYYYSPGTEMFQIIKYRGFGTTVNIGYRYLFSKEKFSVNAATGIGSYRRDEGIETYNQTSSYPAFCLNGGLSYYPVKWLSINCTGSYYMLFAMTGGDSPGKLKNIANIKLGASYYVRF